MEEKDLPENDNTDVTDTDSVPESGVDVLNMSDEEFTEADNKGELDFSNKEEETTDTNSTESSLVTSTPRLVELSVRFSIEALIVLTPLSYKYNKLITLLVESCVNCLLYEASSILSIVIDTFSSETNNSFLIIVFHL